jgi:hypothetical protein
MSLQSKTKAEAEHLQRVTELPCCVPGCYHQVQAHHILRVGRRISHWHTIPLCFDHHQAQSRLPYGFAVHKGTKEFEKRFGTQWEMLERTCETLGIPYPPPEG